LYSKGEGPKGRGSQWNRCGISWKGPRGVGGGLIDKKVFILFYFTPPVKAITLRDIK
jgi:hypothetical protein